MWFLRFEAKLAGTLQQDRLEQLQNKYAMQLQLETPNLSQIQMSAAQGTCTMSQQQLEHCLQSNSSGWSNS